MSLRAASLSLLAFATVGCTPPWGGEQIVPDLPDAAVRDFGPGDFDEGPFFTGPTDPPPQLGATVQQAATPPPISGGTLLITRDGATGIAADPDRDAIYVVDLAGAVRATIALQPGDEPGRGVEDAAGHVHVALRGGGAVVDLDPASGQLLGRRPACPAPRGIAYDPASDALVLACASGELVTLPAAGGAPTRVLRLERDLRDVVVAGASLFVSKLKTAEVLVVDASGAITQRISPPSLSDQTVRAGASFDPTLAWRMVRFGPGAVVAHQRALADVVVPAPGGYGADQSPCPSGIVHSTVEVVTTAGVTPGPVLLSTVLPVDIAIDATGNYAVVAAGNAHNGIGQIVLGTLGGTLCQPNAPQNPALPGFEVIAVALDGQGNLYAQSREPAALIRLGPLTATVSPSSIPLADTSVEDTGHAIFHANSGGSLACASCHAEGGEDGHVWKFAALGPRRTQSMRIGVIGTEPFHWDGDESNLPSLVADVFQGRMSGPFLGDDQVGALSHFLGAIKPWPATPAVDAASASRGAALFQGDAGCAGCHNGPKLTANVSVNVGTDQGTPLQIPSLLGVGWRAPFLHDGCAPALADRFGPCGGGDLHGHTSPLSPADIADLVSYLDTL